MLAEKLLLVLLNRLDPNDKAQLLTFVIASDFPATGSGYIDTCQQGGSRPWKRVRGPESHSGGADPPSRLPVTFSSGGHSLSHLKSLLPQRVFAVKGCTSCSCPDLCGPIPRVLISEGRSRAFLYLAKSRCHCHPTHKGREV